MSVTEKVSSKKKEKKKKKKERQTPSLGFDIYRSSGDNTFGEFVLDGIADIFCL